MEDQVAVFIVDDESRVLERCEIRPEQIDLRQELSEALGKREAEEAALVAIQLAQKMGGWFPFYFQNLLDQKLGVRDLLWKFHFLVDENWVVLCGDGKYRFTQFFIERCAEASQRLLRVAA